MESEGTALHCAAAGGHWRSARLLLNAGAEMDNRDTNGKTALHFAAEGGHLEVVQRSFYIEKLLHTTSFCTQHAFTHSKRLHTEQFYTQCFHTWQAFTHSEAFTQRSFYTDKLLHTEKLLHTASFYRKKRTEKRSCM